MSGLYPELSAKCDKAREALREHMTERGLLEGDGWKIYEFTRPVDGGTELVLRPVHSALESPDALECTCRIEEQGAKPITECSE